MYLSLKYCYSLGAACAPAVTRGRMAKLQQEGPWSDSWSRPWGHGDCCFRSCVEPVGCVWTGCRRGPGPGLSRSDPRHQVQRAARPRRAMSCPHDTVCPSRYGTICVPLPYTLQGSELGLCSVAHAHLSQVLFCLRTVSPPSPHGGICFSLIHDCFLFWLWSCFRS